MAIVNDGDMAVLRRKDSVIASIIERFGNPPRWKRGADFVSLCRIILEQQVSLESANAHYKKLDGYLAAFEPEQILRLSDEEMKACQISRQKASYLRALSEAVISGELVFDVLAMKDEDEIRALLTGIKGIGNWTADIFLMFCLQKKDVFPIGDIAVMKTVRELYGLETREEIGDLSEQWRPYRSLAAYCFWHYYLRTRNR